MRACAQDQEGEFFRLRGGVMEFGTVDKVEMVLYEEHALIHRYITESPDRIILATWGGFVRGWVGCA